MKNFYKVALSTAVLVLGSALPVISQIDNGLEFTTSFPFYAGHAKMPAGSYRITQADVDAYELLVQSVDGKYSAFVEYIATRSAQPHKQSDVTFEKYGSVDYLDRIWVEGQTYGMKVDPTKAEKKAAAIAGPVEHSIVGKKH
jgi:hypothetical protein